MKPWISYYVTIMTLRISEYYNFGLLPAPALVKQQHYDWAIIVWVFPWALDHLNFPMSSCYKLFTQCTRFQNWKEPKIFASVLSDTTRREIIFLIYNIIFFIYFVSDFNALYSHNYIHLFRSSFGALRSLHIWRVYPIRICQLPLNYTETALCVRE